MASIRLTRTALALGSAALVATALLLGGDRTVDGAADAEGLVGRLETVLDATPSGTMRIGAAEPRARATPTAQTRVPEAGAEIAAATRVALAAADAAARQPAAATARPARSEAVETVEAVEAVGAVEAAPRPNAAGFRLAAAGAPPAFTLRGHDAWMAAEAGWVAAGGIAPATIEPRPMPRRR